MDNFTTYYSAVIRELMMIESEVLRYRVEINLSLLEIVRLNNVLDNVIVYGTNSVESIPLGASADFKAVLSSNIQNLEKFNHAIFIRLADHGINLDLLRSDAVNAHHHYQSDFKNKVCFSKTRELTEKMDELCKLISSILC